ncbi:MAG: DUF2334 domain-containing protein [Candidatus Omnitrophota bacterium]
MKSRLVTQLILVFVSVIIAFFVVYFPPQLAYAQPAHLPQAIILYDENKDLDEGPIYAAVLASLLGHFKLDYEIKPVAQYLPGELNKFDFIFYLGYIRNGYIPQAFFEDVSKTAKTVVWFGHNLNQLQAYVGREFLKKYGFCFLRSISSQATQEGAPADFFSVFKYKDKVLSRKEITGIPDTLIYLTITKAKITDGSLAKAKAWALDSQSKEELPYIIQSKNFWFVANIPFSFLELRDRYLIFCDILHDILKINHPAKLKALVRIEDISPDTDPSQLKKVVDFFEEEEIPFSIAVIPVFKDTSKKQGPKKGELHFSDAQETLELLKKEQAAGVPLVMHGFTHQLDYAKNPSLRVTSVGYEFWDSENNSPVQGDSVEYVKGRIEKGKQELAQNGLKPFAFEVPHYTASALDYRVFAQEFPINYHDPVYYRQSAGSQGMRQSPPYIIYKDFYGQFLIPASTLDNIEYEDAKDRNELDKKIAMIIKQAEAVSIVRDGIASFYIHPFVIKAMQQNRINGLAELKKITDALKAMGYEFVSLKSIALDK